MKAPRSRRALAVLLGMTLVAAYFAPATKRDEVLLAERPRAVPLRAEPATARETGVRVLAIQPRAADQTIAAGVFAPRQWALPLNPLPKNLVAEPAPAPPPVAPALPFRVMGRYQEDNQGAVFLQHNDQNLVVRVGDTIAGQYKAERLEGSTLTLRYLPLDQTQQLDVGAAP